MFCSRCFSPTHHWCPRHGGDLETLLSWKRDNRIPENSLAPTSSLRAPGSQVVAGKTPEQFPVQTPTKLALLSAN